jgi:hypothetical protein
MVWELSRPQGVALANLTADGTMTAAEKVLLVWTLGSAIMLSMMMYFSRR